VRGTDAAVRNVTLPAEAHGCGARESVLRTLAERVSWFDRDVKNAGPRAAGGTWSRRRGNHGDCPCQTP
jgi:hypothetical protein